MTVVLCSFVECCDTVPSVSVTVYVVNASFQINFTPETISFMMHSAAAEVW
jgi:hypothetical protein